MRSERNQLTELIHLLKKDELLPVVVFCFSKKRSGRRPAAMSSLSAMGCSHTACFAKEDQ